jgi:hypothetical protein
MGGVRTVFAPIAITPELLKRFWNKTQLLPNGCVRWTGNLNDNGYGCFHIHGRTQKAHVIAWRLANGGKGVPNGLNVSHKCGDKACVNVDHFELLTPSEITTKANRTRGRVIKADSIKLKPIMLAAKPLAKQITYVWKCLGCGVVNRRDSLRVTASAAACACGVYCQTRNMHKEVER